MPVFNDAVPDRPKSMGQQPSAGLLTLNLHVPELVVGLSCAAIAYKSSQKPENVGSSRVPPG